MSFDSADRQRTVPGIGPGGWDSTFLSRSQEAHAGIARIAHAHTKCANCGKHACGPAGSPTCAQLQRFGDPDVHVPVAPSVLYSLYTEDTGVLDRIITPYFAGATILSGTGIWKGSLEPCAVIQIVAAPSDRVRVLQLARAIIRTGQTSVLVTSLGREGFASFTVGT